MCHTLILGTIVSPSRSSLELAAPVIKLRSNTVLKDE